MQNFSQDPQAYTGEIRKKDYYNFFYQELARTECNSVLDIGCASGDFLYHLPDEMTGIGVDTSEELIDGANKTRKRNNISFFCKDILDKDFTEQADAVVMTGFLCTFLEFKKVLDLAISRARKLVLINDFFNPFGVDVKMSIRCPEFTPKEFENIYTIWSTKTISDYLSLCEGIQYKLVPYEMKTELSFRDHPLHNYHVMHQSERVLTNKSGMILRGYNLIIEVSDR